MSPGRKPSLRGLRDEAARCRRCPLYARATQTVFGEGRTRGLMLVGEQPGDAEDRTGTPFVGPAGRLLRELPHEAGIAENGIYLTNAVKHFKWRPAGTRRIHDRPRRTEVRACSHWLVLELETVRPTLVVALGATAAQALLGPSARVGALRGRPVWRAGCPSSPRSIRPPCSAPTRTGRYGGPSSSTTSYWRGRPPRRSRELRRRRPRSPDR